jgi:prepilin-type N-terminal cleavage/methylation domain-containing protein
MNTQMKAILAKKLANKKKLNGFTLIELMVVVAIVGILSGVGLPQLLKAQDKAKDSVAVATVTNAAKECSLLLVTEGDGNNFEADNYSVGDNDLGGDCQTEGTLTLVSESADAPIATVVFDIGGIPSPATLEAAAAPAAGDGG